MTRLRMIITKKARPWGFALLAGIALVMLGMGHVYAGYARDLLVNLGTSVLVVALTYAIFDPMFQELRNARVSEQPFFDDVRFSRNVEYAATVVRIMDTGNHILEGRQRDRFLEALRVAAERGVQIQILLLDPDAKATEQRAEEITPVDVRGVIVENLRYLYRCKSGMTPLHADNLVVKTYDALPALQLHQWDDRALISFYPVGTRASASPHLEINVSSSLGQFAERRFHELWHNEITTTLDQWWMTELSFCRDGTRVASREVRYAEHRGDVFIDGAHIADLLIDFGREHITAEDNPGRRPCDEECAYAMTRLPAAAGLYEEVIAEFNHKYGEADRHRTIEPVILRLELLDRVAAA
ncbi:hypothetical protein [Actinoplanes sp. L3-i22]|uniref:hypothetical protein n=1 Tax=Actinoplanes sp. L3-i22 TaxID=2836373 RepID=UPI001C77990B|nr:hypothetical protein [Actinoplanes sp. L3-i22]BCY07206.1 hypothetical protein L3i22_022940 [Actinoplanes sp. L3-i22]